jgi:hypothetical protein
MTAQPHTSPEELEKLLARLPKTPILIPIKPNEKKPDVPKGESWKDPKYYLTPTQAVERLKLGKNVGIVATDWLVIVDLDDPQKYELPIETLTVQTRNGKLHKYYRNAGDVENAVGKNTLAKCGEVRAEWQYVIAPGSYVLTDAEANDNADGLYRVIKNVPLTLLRKNDLPRDFVPNEETPATVREAWTKPVTIRNKNGLCIEEIRKKDQRLDKLLNGENPDLPSASEGDMATLSKLLNWKFQENEAIAILRQYRNRDKLDRDDYIVGMLKKIKQVSPTLTDNQQDYENNHYVIKPTIVTTDYIAEMVWNREEPPYYMIYDFTSGKFSKQTQIDLGECDKKGKKILYIPPFNESLKKGLVIVPSGVTETTFKEILEEIDKFAISSYDPCGQDALLNLLTRITVGSWFLDRFVANPKFDIAGSGKFAPILPIRGPSQSGKNRLAFVLRLLSYRPYFEMSTYRIPSLYRPLDLWQGTLVLDEADFANTNEKSELIHFLNCRATGTPLSRQNPKNPKITDTFSNFGITIVTQRRAFDDNATESRSLPFYSEVSDKHLPVIETDEMLKQGLELQNKLLYLRMKYYRLVTINKEEWIKSLNDHRLVASLLPLLALSKHEPSLKETIMTTAKDVERAKVEEKANSMDGLIINYLWEKISENLFENWRPNIFYILESLAIEEYDGIEKTQKTALTTRHIADHFKWSPQSIRKTLASLGIVQKGLSYSVKVDGKSQRVIFFDPKRIDKRLREFVVNYTPGAVTQVT